MEKSDPSAILITSTVEKAELISAIGREIDRIDRQSASNGYTNWALWAALGVMGWKTLELLKTASPSELLRIYLLLVVALATGRMTFKLVTTRLSTGQAYFQSPSFGPGGVARLLLVAVVLALCISIQWVHGFSSGWKFWVPMAFLGMPLLMLGTFYFVPKIPVAKDLSGGISSGTRWFVGLLSVLGVASLAAIFSLIDVQTLLKPTDGVKVGLLSAVGTVLVLRLARNIEASERRTSFQRLETELTLAKVDVAEAKERYENLMLGMNVSTAARPWVDAVMLPLEEANANLSEVKQLLTKYTAASAETEDNAPLDLAVRDRAKVLFANVRESVASSSKAYIRLKAVSRALFGEKELSKSPIAAENERIIESRKKLDKSFKEIQELIG